MILVHSLSLIGSWDQDSKESEITFYRRTSTMLDYIFKNTDIILNEHVMKFYFIYIYIYIYICA